MTSLGIHELVERIIVAAPGESAADAYKIPQAAFIFSTVLVRF